MFDSKNFLNKIKVSKVSFKTMHKNSLMLSPVQKFCIFKSKLKGMYFVNLNCYIINVLIIQHIKIAHSMAPRLNKTRKIAFIYHLVIN